VSVLENSLPLRDEQRQKLIALALEQTKPPKQFGQTDRYVVMCNLSRLPETTLRPLFDETEWKTLGQHFAEAIAHERLLRRDGKIKDEEGGEKGP
jgi:hypothetical protein